MPLTQIAAAMELCFLASGETLVVLDADECEAKTAMVVKQTLAAKYGISMHRFTHRSFLQDDSGEIADEVSASVPLGVQFVLLELSSPDAEQREIVILASRGNNLVLLEKLLQYPLKPEVNDRGGLSPSKLIDQRDSVGNAPLHVAARFSHF